MIQNWEYLREYELIKQDVLDSVDQVFSSGRLILGSQVAQFEKHFAQYCGAAFGVGVNSGTDALFLALKALDIGPKDEVITVSNTAVPTVAAIRATGAQPVFIDVRADTYLMNVDQLESHITPHTKAIVPVHLYGHPVDMEPLTCVAKKHHLKVVEDCAQSHGALYKKRMTGVLGDCGAFSFYPTKILGAYGDAGMVVTSDEALFQRLKRIRMYGMDEQYYAEEEGFNTRLDEVQASILLKKMKRLEKQIQWRQKIAERYTQGLADLEIILPTIQRGCSHHFYLYVIQVESRDRLLAYLREQGIEARIHFPYPIHLMKAYAFLGYRQGDLPVTERLAQRILSLPLSAGMTLEEVDQVMIAIHRFFEKG